MSGLMHPRVAHNYAAQGYYPTDEATLHGLDHLLAPTEAALKILDPLLRLRGCADVVGATLSLCRHLRYRGQRRTGGSRTKAAAAPTARRCLGQ